MDAFLRHKQVPRVFLSCWYAWYPVEFFGDYRSKTKFAKDFPNVICITNCKPRYSKLIRTEKCVSNYGQNVTFSERKNRFTCIITAVSNDACMSSAAN